MNQISNHVSSFYNQFPFPLDCEVSEQQYLHEQICFFSRLDRSRYLSKNMSVLVAGCGTNQAVSVALSLPEAKITAIDLSETSLSVSEKLAKALGVTNIVFHTADIMNLPQIGPFDFISSFGVLHHLSDPLQGLKNLRKILKPDGVMELMLYSDSHRYFIQKIQRIISLLAGEAATHEERLRVAREFFESVTPGSWPYGIYLDIAGVRNLADRNLPAFTDTYIHPQEVSYTYSELCAYLDQGGVQLVEFLHPDEWHQKLRIYDNQFLENQFAKCHLQARHELIDLLNGPLFMFYARPREALVPESYLDSTFCADSTILKPNRIRYHRFDHAQNLVGSFDAHCQITPNQKTPEFVDVQFYTHQFSDNRIIRDILDLCQGESSAKSLLELIAKKYRVTSDEVRPVFCHVVKRLINNKVLVVG